MRAFVRRWRAAGRVLLLCASLLSIGSALAAPPGSSPDPSAAPAAPAPPPQRPIHGKWTDLTSGVQLEFKHNGSLTETRPDGGEVRGHYALMDETHLRIQMHSERLPTAAFVVGVTIRGNTMEFSRPDGTVLRRFRRGQAQNP